MSDALRMSMLITACALFVFVLFLLHRRQFNLKYSLIWFFSCFGIVFVALVPQIVERLGTLIGIKTSSNMVFLVILFFVILLLISLTVIVTELQRKIKTLIQYVGILEKKCLQNGKMSDNICLQKEDCK